MADELEAERPAASTPAAAAAPPAPPAPPDMAAIRAEAHAAARARAEGIAALCDLAGVPQQAATFIGSDKSEATVRAELLAARAAASAVGGEVSAARPPGAGVTAQQPGGPQRMTHAEADAHWNRVGARVCGTSWKGI